MNLRTKITITIALFLLIMAGSLGIWSINSQTSQIEIQENQRLESLADSFQSLVDEREQMALALAVQIAEIPEVQKAFAERDRERLIELTHGAYQTLDETFGVPQAQFHLAPATSFLRLHTLDTRGDDLSAFRFTVLTANAEQRNISGLEEGKASWGIRGVTPVFYNGEHVGTFEVGLSFGEELLQEYKDKFGADVTAYFSRELSKVVTFEEESGDVEQTGFTEYATTLTENRHTVEQHTGILEDTIQYGAEAETFERHEEGDEQFAEHAGPIYDFSGDVVGGFILRVDRAETVAQLNASRNTAILVAVVVLVVTGAAALVVTDRVIVRPVRDLSAVAEEFTAGRLDARAEVGSQDELGTLAVTFNGMAERVGTLLQDLERRAQVVSTSAEVSRRLSTIIERQQLVLEVVEQVQQSFNYYHAHIYLLDEASGDLLMAGGTGAAGRELLASGHKIAKGRGLVGRAAESNTVVLVPDVSKEPGWLPNRLLPDTQAEIAVPIAAGARVLGVLDVQHNIPDGLSEEDASLLESIAGQVAVALQNILLFEEAQDKIKAESQITEITQRIQGATSTDDILQVAARELGRALGAKRSTVHLNVGAPSGNGQERKPDPVLTEHKEN